MRLRYFVTTAVMIAASLAAHADTVTFTYSGADTGIAGSSTGSGDFTFNGPATNLTLGDLTGFSFEQTTIIFGGSDSGSFSYSLSDLTSFSATLSGDELLTLTLGTDEIAPNPGSDFDAETFTVTSLSAGGAQTSAGGLRLQVGQVVQQTAVTPEPSSLLLLGTGVLGMVGAARRHFKA